MVIRHKNSQYANAIRTISRRDALILGGAAAGSLWLPGGFANAQTVSFDYYIGPSGSDSNPGTQSQPWAITALNTKRTTYAGKRVGLLDGTYDLVAILGQPTADFSTNQLVVAGGSASSPTVVGAVNSLMAIIDGNRPACTSGAECGIIGPGGSYVTFDGLKIVRANYRAMVNYSGGGNNIIVQNCHFYDQVFEVGTGGGKNSATIFMQGKSNCVIRNSRIEIGGAPIDSNRHAFIQFYDSTDCVVEYCTIIGSSSPPSGNGVHFKNGSNHRMTVRYCYIDRSASSANGTSKDCIQWSCESAGTDGSETCHHNVLINSNGSCLYSSGANNAWQIYNNTLIGNPTYAEAGLDRLDAGNPTSVNIYNNVFSRGSTGYRGDITIGSIAVLGTMDHNLYDSNPAPKISIYNGSTYSSLSSWQSASGKDLTSIASSLSFFLGTGVEAARYQLSSSVLSAVISNLTQLGAWGSGATQVGCSFTGTGIRVPAAPQIINVT